MAEFIPKYRTRLAPEGARTLSHLCGEQVTSLFSNVVYVLLNPGEPGSLRLQFRSGAGETYGGERREVVGIHVLPPPKPLSSLDDLSSTQEHLVLNDQLESVGVLNCYAMFGSPYPIEVEPVGESKRFGGPASGVWLINPMGPIAERLRELPRATSWLNEVDVGVYLRFSSRREIVITSQGFTSFVNLLQPGPAFDEIFEQTRLVPIDERTDAV
jgi:hypothetical protein